jgi:hypothetical protein
MGARVISRVRGDLLWVRYWDCVSKRNRPGRYIMRGIKEREVVACIISMLPCSNSKGYGRIMASEHDYKKAELCCQA